MLEVTAADPRMGLTLAPLRPVAIDLWRTVDAPNDLDDANDVAWDCWKREEARDDMWDA